MWDAFKGLPGIPNFVTVFRALLGLVIPFFLLAHQPLFHWVGLLIFVVAAVTDFIDGYLARSFSWTSPLGKILDPTADKILIIASLVTFAWLDLFSPYWLIPIVVREFIVTFCRIGWSLEGVSVGAEQAGKMKFVSQVSLVIFSYLYYFSFSHPLMEGWRHGLHYAVLGSLIVANFLTLFSGIFFLMNNRQHLGTTAFRRFAAACGVGFISFAPGTWGSAMGLLFVCAVQIHPVLFWIVFFFWMGVGFWACKKIDLKNDPDPHFVVLDEVCGMMLSLYAIPLSFGSLVVGFLLFRILDVIKPFGIRKLEKLPGFWGILMDDLAAGAVAWLVLWGIFVRGV